MKRKILGAGLIAAWLLLVASSGFAAGPLVAGKFQGRIAYSADGNHNDPDDWIASPVALAIFAESGLKDRLVHFDYNCILPKTDPEWEKIHATSVLGAAERYGYDKSLFHDCRQDVDRAVASIAKAIDDSTAENPLYFIVAGPMEVPFMGIQKSNPAKRTFVYCISHSRWNDGFAAKYSFTHTKRSVIPSGVNWVQIADQNRLLSLSPYGKPAAPEAFAPYHWMRDSADSKVRFLWERMLVSTRPDPSDAGMAYFLATGDEEASPAKLKRLLDEHQPPQPAAARKAVRLEAENFRELEGFAVEDTNDRTASHRLSVKSTASGPAAIRTRFVEPYAAAQGRYDVVVRYRGESDAPCRMKLLINGVARGDGWETAGKGEWASHTLRDVEIRAGDAIAVHTEGSGSRLDYVQLTGR
jgi:hypothetical protein